MPREGEVRPQVDTTNKLLQDAKQTAEGTIAFMQAESDSMARLVQRIRDRQAAREGGANSAPPPNTSESTESSRSTSPTLSTNSSENS